MQNKNSKYQRTIMLDDIMYWRTCRQEGSIQHCVPPWLMPQHSCNHRHQQPDQLQYSLSVHLLGTPSTLLGGPMVYVTSLSGLLDMLTNRPGAPW